ncbi:unnamed protein product [Microthlaspi erraticum]|uniref:SHSP domain-containing protein n=1 Tax=Microthlaspi erraticum TaxID=1685480 RepID=A0A6D2JKZ2_9BRAS|nr:unnamed protein product [Microthlaspi erraticum]
MTGGYCIDLSRFPSVPEGFYATNSQFQIAGPKGFIQVKVLENDKLYVRVDLPGVPDDAIRHRVDAVRQKIVFFSGETLRDGNVKEGVREYSGTAGLGCDCCEITGVDAKMKDGVLRMVVSRVKVKDHENKCDLVVPPFTGRSGRDIEDHPFVVRGRKGALYGEATRGGRGGGLYFTVDVPGVSSEDAVEVFALEDEVRFYAEVKTASEHEESARVYLGSVLSDAPSSRMPSLLSYAITWDVVFGVLKVRVAPPSPNNNN